MPDDPDADRPKERFDDGKHQSRDRSDANVSASVGAGLLMRSRKFVVRSLRVQTLGLSPIPSDGLKS